MNQEEKRKILSFVEKIDRRNLPGYINNFDYNAPDGFESRIQQIFECLFKNVYLPKGYTILVGIPKEPKKPDFNALINFTDSEIVHVRDDILKLDYSDCLLLSNVARDIRNDLEHGTYRASDDDRLKTQLISVLFKALKNSYEYSTKEKLEITFMEFLEALKFSRIDEEHNKVIKDLHESIEKQEQDHEIEIKSLKEDFEKEKAEFKKQYSLEIKKAVIKTRETKQKKSKEPVIEENKIADEIKLYPVQRNEQYIIPKEIGTNLELLSSPQIDIAFDFIKKGWFTEASNEVADIDNPLKNYVLFLCNNQLKNIEELINNGDFKVLLAQLYGILIDLPSKNVSLITNDIIESFINLKGATFSKKIDLYKFICTIGNKDMRKCRKHFFEYLLTCKEDNSTCIEGYKLFYASIPDNKYKKETIESFEMLLKEYKYDLMFLIKNRVLVKFDDPQMIRLLFLAELHSNDFLYLSEKLQDLHSTKYLNLLLNYDYYNEKEEFKKLLRAITTYINKELSTLDKWHFDNVVMLLECVSKYLSTDELNALLQKYIVAFKKKEIWTKYSDDALTLLNLVKNNTNCVNELTECWIKEAVENKRDFYVSVNNFAESCGIESEFVLRNEILLKLAISVNYTKLYGAPEKIFPVQISHYLEVTNNIKFINELISVLANNVEVQTAIAYANAFEILLQFCNKDKQFIYDNTEKIALSLVEIGHFDKANRFYRYLLTMNMNQSRCYWGILFCECRAKNKDELSEVNDLYSIDLFKHILRLSKEEDETIYKECISLLSQNKAVNKVKADKLHQKKMRSFSFAVYITQVLSIVMLFSAFLVNPSGMWPFLIVAFLIFISIFIFTFLKTKEKRGITTSICIFTFILGSLLSLSGVHIYKAANAERIYNDILLHQIKNFEFKSDIREIRKTIRKLPITYGYTRTIKNECDDLESDLRYSGRLEFYWVSNFEKYNSNWDCSRYLYRADIYNLVYGAEWQIDNGTKTFKYCWESGSGETLYGKSLPNNMESGKDYYFYTTYGYYNDRSYTVNQYIEFGYRNKKDKDDKFLAFRVGNYRLNDNNKGVLDVYCYSDGSTHTLTFLKSV